MFRTNLFNAIENAFKTQDSNTKSTWEIAGLNLPLPVWRRSSTELSRSVVINPLSWKNGKSERSSTRCKLDRKRMINLQIVPCRDIFWIFCYFGLFKGVFVAGPNQTRTPSSFGAGENQKGTSNRASAAPHEWLLWDSCLYCYFSKAICLSVCLWGLSECRQSHRHNDRPTIVCHSIH